MTVFPAQALLAAGMALLATAAGAQTSVGNAQMVSVTGHCSRLLVGERDLTAACSTRVLNVVYPDGRVSFYFVLADGPVVSFSGMDGENPTPDTDVVHVDKVLMTHLDTPDKPDVLPAKGTCGFGNPMKGPMTVACEGTFSEGGAFSASFTTDGSPPT